MADKLTGVSVSQYMEQLKHTRGKTNRLFETSFDFQGACEIGIYLAGSCAAFLVRCAFVSQLLGKMFASLR